MSFQIGQRVGDYEVIGKVGHGGMGAVYKVKNVISQRIDAMKVLLPGVEATQELSDRFLREIQVHASLAHPNIAQLLTAFRSGESLLMVMELVEGAGLDSLLRSGAMEIGDAVDCISQVLDALQYAHSKGVIHRDVKPQNILVMPNGKVKLLDFGIAQDQTHQRITMTGMVVGSLSYMSPEQVSASPVDGRSDLYSVGILLFQALTGCIPFRGGSDYEVMRAHMSQRPQAPIELNPAIPQALSDAVIRAIAKQPENRFQSAADFRSAILPFSRHCSSNLAILSQTTLSQTAKPAGEPVHSSRTLDSVSIASVSNRLAPFVGPIAPRLVSTASRKAVSIEDLCRRVADEIESATDRKAFLGSCSDLIGGHANQQKTPLPATVAMSPTPVPASTVALAIDNAHLERIRTELAAYIGPMAKIIISRALKQSRTIDQFFDALGAEIPSPADRRKFLSKVR